MQLQSKSSKSFRAARSVALYAVLGLATVFGIVALKKARTPATPRVKLAPRRSMDTSGWAVLSRAANRWQPTDSLQQIAPYWDRIGYRTIEQIDAHLENSQAPVSDALQLQLLGNKSEYYMYEGNAAAAYSTLQRARSLVEGTPFLKREYLSSIIFFQGVAALRRGEDDNCIMCRGESSCILPIGSEAVHQKPDGSRLAIKHFTEYLREFPDDLEVQWLLNLAHMTLGEYPRKVDPQYLVRIDKFLNSEFDIGRFRDIGHQVGLNRFNQAGGALMDDFDNDGLLDVVVSSIDPMQVLGFYRNLGNGKFEERAEPANLADQLGGLVCMQADYNNDGLLDIYIARGAWQLVPMRPSLLRNDGGGKFTDVTESVGLLDPVNSNAAAWADYDNDGWIDLFVCCEKQAHRLYRNLGNGTFQSVATQAGVVIDGESFGKGCAWLDYDNDDFPDLFVNQLSGAGQLFHNNRNGTFSNVTESMGIDGPHGGFSCWTWDYDNDGWLDIFATCYDRSLKDIVNGLMGQPHERNPSKLFRNLNGTTFQDMTREAGLDMVFATMGSNFGDLDNDGYLDMYLGTGDQDLSTLVPNRMFKNVDGGRFAEITASAGVGHLQKGHGVAFGDWDRDGNVDVFINMGGTIPGDKYHNILFQNPGHDNRWLTVKLVGKRTNQAALGARIKAVTDGNPPLTVHRVISPGSSFGSNPLQQTLGLAKADRVAVLEVHWPTSGTTQIFHDVAVNQAIEITELADEYRTLDWQPVSVPKEQGTR
jgi:hypothetical protein